jgi:hypothetical protein
MNAVTVYLELFSCKDSDKNELQVCKVFMKLPVLAKIIVNIFLKFLIGNKCLALEKNYGQSFLIRQYCADR